MIFAKVVISTHVPAMLLDICAFFVRKPGAGTFPAVFPGGASAATPRLPAWPSARPRGLCACPRGVATVEAGVYSLLLHTHSFQPCALHLPGREYAFCVHF